VFICATSKNNSSMNDDKLSSGRLVWLPNRLGGALSEWNRDTHAWYHESVAPSFQQEAFACLPGLVED
jgi:hypothetical protein